MLALPPAPAATPRRQLLVGTALVSAAAISLVGGMLGLWLRFRHDAIAVPDGGWLPQGAEVPEVATNVMLIAFGFICVLAQWAVYAARRGDSPHTGVAIGLVALLGIAVINSQAFVYDRMALPVRGDTAYNAMFYALTGTFVALVVAGVTFSAVTAFRYLGGRTMDREIVTAHAIWWYVLTALYSVIWLAVYVTK